MSEDLNRKRKIALGMVSWPLSSSSPARKLQDRVAVSEDDLVHGKRFGSCGLCDDARLESLGPGPADPTEFRAPMGLGSEWLRERLEHKSHAEGSGVNDSWASHDSD